MRCSRFTGPKGAFRVFRAPPSPLGRPLTHIDDTPWVVPVGPWAGPKGPRIGRALRCANSPPTGPRPGTSVRGKLGLIHEPGPPSQNGSPPVKSVYRGRWKYPKGSRAAIQTGGLRIECGLRRPGPALAPPTHVHGRDSETRVSEPRAAFPGGIRAAGAVYGPMRPAGGGWGVYCGQG